MTGVLPFLLFSLSSQSFTHMDAHSSQSFTSIFAGTQTKPKSKQKDIPKYPEPDGDPSY